MITEEVKMRNNSKKESAMSAELAMQREMAYRKQLETSQVKQCDKTRKPSPIQQNKISVPASSCGPKSRPTSFSWFKPSLKPPSPSLSSSPNPILNPKPKGVQGPSPRQTQGPFLPPMNIKPRQGRIAGPRLMARPGLQSGSCQAGPRPEYILGQSAKPTIILPRPHPNLPQGLGIPPRPMSLVGPYCQPRLLIRPNNTANPFPGPSQELKLSPSQKRKEAPNQQLKPDNSSKMSKVYCGVCKVTCSSAANLEMHLTGQKHQAKKKRLQELKTSKNASQMEVNGTRLWCELCEIWCMNEFSYQQHLSGKSHILKLHAVQNK